jgi:hypothetical protein
MAEDPKITDEQHDGQQGERLVGLLIGELKHEWHPAARNEAGIDGMIELRDANSRRVNAHILLCQVKTGDSFISNETDDGFEWKPGAADLGYWENANAPVIVAIVRLRTREAWWKAIDEAFPDADARAARVVRFDKRRDRLNDATNDALWDVARRERERRAVATQMILAGLYAAVGLLDDYEQAQRMLDEGKWPEAAKHGNALATAAAAKHLPRRLIWPAREQEARALEAASRRHDAAPIWAALAQERVDEDDPQAAFDLARAMHYGVGTNDFATALTYVRAGLPEAGIDALDDLRAVYRMAGDAAERQAAAAALADALVFFGLYAEAERIAGRVLGKRHDTAAKRQLALDRLDAAREIGENVAAAWEGLLEDWHAAGPEVLGIALHRRAIDHLRTGDHERARERFEEAARTWALVEGGDEQVAEAAVSAGLTSGMAGQLTADSLPVGARQAAALARGGVRTPAARSDRLITDGLGYLANKDRPDALNRLTLAAMVDRRAGNLFSYRRSALFLARAYEDTEEWAEALRFWIMLGSESRAEAAAAHLELADLLPMLRLDTGPPWERAASFATLAGSRQGP